MNPLGTGRGTSRRSLLGLGLGLPLALAGCSNATGSNAEDGYVTGDGTYSRIQPKDRKGPVRLQGTTVDGKQVDTAAYLGKVVVVNVWASWCPPCRAEAPQLVKAAAATKGTAVFVGLNTRDSNQASAESFIRVSKMTYPHIWDPDAQLLLDFAQLPPRAIPSTLVLDRQGRIAARILGSTNSTTLVGLVQDISAGK